MMKTLFLVRHAKSDWTINTSDFERHLNKRGHKDAPKMAHFLKSKNIKINAFVSSPAKRAITTCKYFAEVFENENIVKVEKLYNASPSDFLEVIDNLNEDINSVALFSHNNGITYFANSLTNENIMHLPTCSVVGFRINTNSWKDFENAEKEFLFFHYPKEI